MSDWNDLIRLQRGSISTAILLCPTGKYTLVGSVPYELTEEYNSGYTTGRKSKIFKTEQEAVDALLSVGCTRFQLADCSWHNNTGPA